MPATALARAADPSTPSAELRSLAALHAPAVLRGLGANPATPLDLLLHLAVWVPGQVLQNPSLRLHALDRGASIFVGIDHPAATELLAHPGRAWLLPLIPSSPSREIRWAASRAPGAPADLLEALTADTDIGVLRGLACHPELPAGVALWLARHASGDIRRRLASFGAISPEAQRALALDANGDVRLALTNNRRLDPAVLLALAGDDGLLVRMSVARHPALPLPALLRCAVDEDDDLREAAAGNPSLPVPALVALAGDRLDEVRAEAAFSPRLPPELLARLADDRAEAVRCAVARNPSTPPAALARLALGPDGEIRAFAASNPATPLDALTALAHDPEAPALALLDNPHLPGPLARLLIDRLLARQHLEEHERSELFRCPALPSDLVEPLLRRLGLDGNRSLPSTTPPDLFDRMARGNRDERLSVCASRDAPPPLLIRLAWDRDPQVAGSARRSLRDLALVLPGADPPDPDEPP